MNRSLYPVTLTLDVPAEVAHGRRVPIVLRVSNETSHAIEIGLGGRDISFDVVITDAAGCVVWRRLQGAAMQAILQLRILAPGETLELHAEWAGRGARGKQVPPGEYTVQALLPTDEPDPLRAPPRRLRLR